MLTRLSQIITLLALNMIPLGCSLPQIEEELASKESSYCKPLSAGSSTMTVSGKALYKAREITDDGLGGAGPARPIRFAEVQIYKTEAIPHKGRQKILVQCGDTDEAGNFQLKLPKAKGAYTIQVNSRGYNSAIRASVLNNPQDKSFFSIRHDFSTAKANVTLEDDALIASHKGSLEGGAFNILDQIYIANEFLREKLNPDNHSCQSCTSTFTVAPKVNIYWTPGFNPGSYYGIGPLSFYIPSEDSLYILGGEGGDTNNTDTDHFDNSIILHEYGHFIEDQYSKTDSPGGAHDGNSIIDPRLAWGEGWADYFQAAVTGNPVYQDSVGNIDGIASLPYNEDFENLTPSSGDVAAVMGEGNFREFSITRALWDLTDTVNADAETAHMDFAYFWEVFTSSSAGFRSNSVYFRNVGHFYELLLDFLTLSVHTGIADIEAAISDENQETSRKDYASLISSVGCTGPFPQMSPDYGRGNSFEDSNLFASNDFYLYQHPGGRLDIKLTYIQVGSDNPGDLDLYIYKSGYIFDENYDDMIGYSEGVYLTDENGQERVNIADVPEGVYLINVKLYEELSSGNDLEYELYSGTDRLCQQGI